ncbi:MAG: 2-oxoacid:acceptor oxidoreductase, partial [Acidimicrobiia bacterium]
FEIFAAGTHRDMSGIEVTVDDVGLRTIATAYNLSQPGNEAVLTIGHPVNDQPVLGTVRRLVGAGVKVV